MQDRARKHAGIDAMRGVLMNQFSACFDDAGARLTKA